jgi:hypothetical protein
MVWSHYVEEANEAADEFVKNGDDFFDAQDDEEYAPPIIMNIEDWETWYSRDLMNMWFSLKTYTEDSGVSNFVMPFATYTKFVEFCYGNSDGMRNSYPS